MDGRCSLKRIVPIQVFSFLVVLLLLGGGWQFQQLNKVERDRNGFVILSHQFSIRLQEFMKTRIRIIRMFASEYHREPGPSPVSFERFAGLLYRQFPGFDSIDLVNDGGIIESVVPLKGHSPALGFDLKKRPEAGALIEKVMRSGQVAVSGPIELFSGDPGVVVLAPVMEDRGPVAIIAGIFRIRRVMDECFSPRERSLYHFQILDADTNGVLYPPQISAAGNKRGMEFESVNLVVGSRTWSLMVFKPGVSGSSVLFSLIIWFLILAVAGILAFFIGGFLKSNRELAGNESRFRMLLDAMPDAFLLVKSGGRVVDFHGSRGWCCFRNISGTGELSDFLPLTTADGNRVDELVRSCFDKKEIRTVEVRFSGPDGPLDVEIRAVPYGEKLVLLIIRDITRQKQTETRLKVSMERYQTIFEESQDPIFITTAGGRLVDINPAGLAFFGAKTLDELRLRTSKDMYYNPEDRVRLLTALRKNGLIHDQHLTLKRLDGTLREVTMSVRLLPAESASDRLLVGTLHDITELTKLHEQLLQAQKMESIGRLAGGIAHDFNNILSGILGYASLMKSKMKASHPFYTYVETIERGAVRASELTARLLGFARKGQFSKVSLDVNKIILDTVQLLQSTIQKTIEIKRELESGIPRVSGDPSQIHQVVMNLCVNARDAMPDGGRLTLSSGSRYIAAPPVTPDGPLPAGTYVFIRIQDTGSGMDAETKRRIFEPFFTTKENKGTGLGLAMVYGVVQNHGGFVNVESEPGTGSTFTIYFPAATGEPGETETEQTETQSGLGEREVGRVLFVDDEADNRSLAKEILESHEIEVILAADGLEALEIYRDQGDSIDGVILDMIMPKMDGKAVLFELKEMDEFVNVMLISGYSNDGEIKKLTEENSLLFMRKPFHIDELVKKTRELIARGKKRS